MAESKKQHYIPQFFLRNFSADGKGLFMAKKSPAPQFIPLSVKDAAARNNAHDAETETYLSVVENRHAWAIKAAINGAAIEGNLKDNLFEVAAFAMVRSPKPLQAIQSILQTVASTAMLDRRSRATRLLRDLGVSPYELIAASQSEIASVLFGGTVNILKDGYANNFGNIQVLRSTAGNFILADCPLSMYCPNEKELPSGILIPQHNVLTLPLSNKIALEFYKEDPPHTNPRLNAAEVAEINRRSIVAADRFLYSRQQDKNILKIIRENANNFAGLKNSQGLLDMDFVLSPDSDPAKTQVISFA